MSDPKKVTMQFTALTDDEARKWLHSVLNAASFSGSQAAEVLRIRAWIESASAATDEAAEQS